MAKASFWGSAVHAAGPLLFAAALTLGGASFPAKSQTMELTQTRPTAERRARLVRTLEREPERRSAEDASRVMIADPVAQHTRSLWAVLLASVLFAVALARGAALRLGRAARSSSIR
jgi:hypothetical protein